MAFGLTVVLSALKAAHQGAPWPSMTPLPLMVILVRLEPERKLSADGKVPIAVILRMAPAESWKVMLLFRVTGPLRKVPAGTKTVPPLPTALTAAWMAAALSALP